MKEIGSYFELEKNRGPMLHEEAIPLGCGRHGLEYLILAKKIKKIAIPLFLCDCIYDLCRKYSLSVRLYSIRKDFLPADFSPDPDEWVYLVNYYGQLNHDKIRDLKKRYTHVMVDNTQAYYSMPVEGCMGLHRWLSSSPGR